MKINRFLYFIIILVIILTGILSRKITSIPFFIGDLLYAVMIYFGIRFIFIHLDRKKAAIIALITCYCIELLQIYDAEWLIALRRTLFGRYVLGQGFLWNDIIAYSFGIIVAYLTDAIIISEKSENLRN